MKCSYTQVDNIVLNGLCYLKPNEMKVMLYVIRHTEGFHRDTVDTSYGVIAKWCNVFKPQVITAIKSLEELKLITIERKPNLLITYNRDKMIEFSLVNVCG